MSGQPAEVIQTPPAGQPAEVQPQAPAVEAKPQPVAQGQGQGAGQTSQPILTEQQLLELIDKRATEISEQKASEIVKQAQKINDKLDARIRGEFESRIAAIEAATGSPLTEPQKYRLEKETRQQILNAQQQEEQEQFQGQPQGQQQVNQIQQADPFQIEAQKIAQKYGNTLVVTGDPEASIVNVSGGILEWAQSYEAAVKAKHDRLANNSTPSLEQNGNPQARIAQTPQRSAGGTLPDVSASELFKM